MTGRGYQFLMEELKRLKSVERPKNMREIEEARGHGDLSENAVTDCCLPVVFSRARDLR